MAQDRSPSQHPQAVVQTPMDAATAEIDRLRRQLREERDQRVHLEMLLDVSEAGHWDWDILTDDVRIQPGWARMLGYSPEELAPIGSGTWRALTHPDDRDSAEFAMRAHIDGASNAAECVFRMRHRDGRWLWIHCRGRVYLRDTNGRARRMAGTNSDVSMLREVEQDAARSRRWLQAVVDASDDVAIITTDAHGSITLFNSGAEQLLGYRADELIGQATPVIFHEPAELAARIAQARERLQREVGPFEALTFDAHAGTSTGEWTLICKDGRRKRVRLSISPIEDASGERLGLVGMVIDLGPLLDAREQARIEAERFTGAFNAAALGMALVSLEGRWLDANDAICAMLGYSRAELLATDFQTVTHPDDLTSDLSLVQDLVDGRIDSYQLDKRYIARAGHLVWGRLSVSLVRTPDGAPLHFVSQVQDVTLEKTGLLRLRESEERTRITLDTVTDIVLTLDRRGSITYANAVARRVLAAQAPDGLVGRSVHDILLLTTEYAPQSALALAPLLDSDDDAVDLAQDLLMPHAGERVPVELTRGWLHDQAGQVDGAVWVIRDVTQQRLKQREAMRLAEVDPLTELANRRGFAAQLEAALLNLRERGQPATLLYMDLDGFKAINDRHGHPAGDLVLEQVAQLLRTSVRDLDVVARMGGDEFAAILIGCSLARAGRIAEDISRGIQQLALAYDGHVLRIGASLGVAPLRAEMNEERAIAAADAQCYLAKSRGHNHIAIETIGMDAAALPAPD